MRSDGSEEDRGKGWDKDVHKEIEDTLPDEQGHVLVELPLLCNMVHLKRLPHELSDHEDAHCCTMRDLQNEGHFWPE